MSSHENRLWALFEKKTFLFHGPYFKLASDSAIVVGQHLQTRITSKPIFLFMEHCRMNESMNYYF